MLKKIVSIKNVGKFRNSAAISNPELARHSFILGANGFGKTTICAILRSLRSGDADYIMCRRTLGVEDTPTADLLFPSGLSHFDGAVWSATHTDLAIFDGVFVAENVHSGEVVNLDNKRNLYRVIIGEESVRLVEEDTNLAAKSREMTGQISAVAGAIQPLIPAGMNLNQFIALAADSDIDGRITDQEAIVEAVRQAKQVEERPALSEITIPTLPAFFAELLAKTIDDIAQDAETRLVDHPSAHPMNEDGENWIEDGLNHTDQGTCPFCGQNIRGLPLISAYRAVFSDSYKALRVDINAVLADIAEQFGDGALGRLNTRVEQNKGATAFWGQYCTFDSDTLVLPGSVLEAVNALGQAAINLVNRKTQAPLEALAIDETFNTAAADYEAAQLRVQEIAEATLAVNVMIVDKKKEAGTGNLQVAESELAHRRAIKARHADPVTNQCANHARLTAEKEVIDNRKTEIREQLDEHTNNVIRRYENRINHYLAVFNTEFTITETRHYFPVASPHQIISSSLTTFQLTWATIRHRLPRRASKTP